MRRSKYTRPLSLAEIQAIYQAGVAGKTPFDDNLPPMVQAGWLDWLSLGVHVFGDYFRYSLVPYPLSAFHLIPLKLEYRFVSTSLSLAVIAVLAMVLWLFRARIPEALFWFSSFGLMLVPVFYFKGMSNTFFAERYLYIPSFAMIALVVSTAGRLKLKELAMTDCSM